MRRFGAGVRKRRFCAGVRKRRFCAGVRKRRFCVGVRKRALQRSCVKFFEMDRCARRAQGARCTHRYNSSCTHGYNSSCTHVVVHSARLILSAKMRARFSCRSTLSSILCCAFPCILAVGAEALSMTPSGDALFAS